MTQLATRGAVCGIWPTAICLRPRNNFGYSSKSNSSKHRVQANPESNEAPSSSSTSSPAAATTSSVPIPLARRALTDAPEWGGFLGTLANSGAITGTLLDGIHSRMGLQVYDMAPLVLGGLKTSLVVPPLLALFYMVLGSLHPIMDNLNPSPATSSIRARCNDVGFVALAFGVLAGLLHLSATMYDQGVPYWQIHAVLGTAALVNWRLFDGTRQGIALALLCGLGAPAVEVLLLQIVPLWHYPQADLGDRFVSWVFWCYFFYTPALGSLARYLWTTMREIELVQRNGAGPAVGRAAPGIVPTGVVPTAADSDSGSIGSGKE